MSKIKYKTVCRDCNKEMPIDTEKSNDNWTVYKERCGDCGARGKMIVV